jgi:PAS domain S-box-containing protein
MTVFDFDPDFSPDMWPDHFRNIREKRVITFETTHRNKEGFSFPMQITAAHMEFFGDELIFSFENNIAERKKAEEALRIAEKTFRDLLETIQLVAVLLDRDGNITFCNDYLLHLTGCEKEELIGRNWFDVCIPHEEKEKIKKVFKSVITEEKDHSHYENCIVTRNGREFLI